jgi:hypothetical protein
MISSSVVDSDPELFWPGLFRNNRAQSGSDLLDKNFFKFLLLFFEMVQFVLDFIYLSFKNL